MIPISELESLMKKIEVRRGPFTLFGLFLREDSPRAWDLVVAAPWLQRGKLKALSQFVQELTKTFGHAEVLESFSRIVTLNQGDRALRAILDDVGPVRHPVERRGQNLYGLLVEHAHILRASRLPPQQSNGRSRKRAAAGLASRS